MITLRRNAALAPLTLTLFGCAELQPQAVATTAWVILTCSPKAFCTRSIEIMFTRLILFLLVALGGAGLTVQMAWNSRLRASTGSPVLTTIISVVVTLVSLVLVWASGATPRST